MNKSDWYTQFLNTEYSYRYYLLKKRLDSIKNSLFSKESWLREREEIFFPKERQKKFVSKE